MDTQKRTQQGSAESSKGGRSLDPAYGFSVSIAIGLLLFIAGLVVSLTIGGDTGVGLIFGIPLLIAGLVVPLFMAREHFTRNDVEGTCPNCGTQIKTSDSTLKLECPGCQKVIAVRDGKLYLDT